MGNRYNHQTLHHLQHKSTFLPMICPVNYTKDVVIPTLEKQSSSLTPKTVRGNVKKIHRKLDFGFSTSMKIMSSAKSSLDYFKLEKLFSGKSTVAKNYCDVGYLYSTRRGKSLDASRRPKIMDVNRVDLIYKRINVVDMDPPLPVIKRVKLAYGGETDNLWKRRFGNGTVALKSLRIHDVPLRVQPLISG